MKRLGFFVCITWFVMSGISNVFFCYESSLSCSPCVELIRWARLHAEWLSVGWQMCHGEGVGREESESFVSITPVLTIYLIELSMKCPKLGPSFRQNWGRNEKWGWKYYTGPKGKKKETKLVFSTKLVFFTGVSYPVLGFALPGALSLLAHILH